MHPSSSNRAAITAQQSPSNNNGRNLIGRDGISKTMRWKNYAVFGNFADARTFPTRHAGANSTKRLWFTRDHEQETERCALRRLLR
jgi:hypothetical protein